MGFWRIFWTVMLLTVHLTYLPWGLRAQEAPQTDPPQFAPVEDKILGVEKAEETVVHHWVHLNLVDVNIFIRLGIAGAILLIQALLICLVGYFFHKLEDKVTVYGNKYLKPLSIKKYRLLEIAQILKGCYFLLRIVKYLVIAFQLYLTLPMIFSLFEPTKDLAFTLFSYILNPLKKTGQAIIEFIPNVITIGVIIFIFRYVIRSLRFFVDQIERRKLVIPGFYPDWAVPTFNIVRVLLYAFTVIVIYPYLPGSDSTVFQGVSLFVGILFSLGSSAFIGNLVAGIVLTYMRPFKIGDRIKIGEVVGFVVEKSAIVTRLRTHKNEYVTFPNSAVLSSSITNYNFSVDNVHDRGLILYATITFGYSTPWQTVHAILIESALKAKYVEPDPMPFVLQTKLDDFYAHYEINVYTKAVDKVPTVYSELFQSIQNGFREAGLDMTVAYFRANALTFSEPQRIVPRAEPEGTAAREEGKT
jgi:small-conductance mechanosensitive channel